MNLAITSDFPSSANDAVLLRIRQAAANPRVAWVPPLTSAGRERFPAAQAQFRSLGISTVEFCDIDEQPDERQLSQLDRYDAVYFTGGDPLVFRRNIERSGISGAIEKCLAAGRLIVAASGGAMQFTQNLSLYRLLSEPFDTVMAERNRYAGLGIVSYELLPHLNRLDAEFLDNVQRYSERIPCDIVALEDGAAMIHTEADARCVGRGMRFRGGFRTEIEQAPTPFR